MFDSEYSDTKFINIQKFSKFFWLEIHKHFVFITNIEILIVDSQQVFLALSKKITEK